MSSFVQEQLFRTINIVSVRPNTSKPSVQSLYLPIPSKETQQSISDEIRKLRNRVRELLNDSQQALIEAKKEVENLILVGNV